MTDLEESYIRKFKKAYQDYFSEQITDKDARERFFKMADLFRVIIYGAPTNDRDQIPTAIPPVDGFNRSANIDQ